MRTPIVLIVYKRTQALPAILEAVRAARPPALFLVADGPAGPGERQQVEATRQLLERLEWCPDVRRDYSESNLGLAARVITGLDWVFQQTDRAIVLEDDVVPGPDFFAFCEHALERYQDHERVAHVSGLSLSGPGSPRPEGPDYSFVQIPASWGYATWRRAWVECDWSALSSEAAQRQRSKPAPMFMRQLAAARAPWPEVDENRALRDRVNATGRYCASWMKMVRTGWLPESFLGAWMYHLVEHDLLAVAPWRNTVRYLGFDEAATHTRARNHALSALSIERMNRPLKSPAEVTLDHEHQARCAAFMDGHFFGRPA